MARISAAQFACTLENMARSWMNIPEDERQPKSWAQSFFNDYRSSCEQMITRWASGQSSHPNAAELAQIYPPTEDGSSVDRLYQDIWDLQDDPEVQEAEQRMRAAMYTAPDPPGAEGEGGDESYPAPENTPGAEVIGPGQNVYAFWPDENHPEGGTWMEATVNEIGEDGQVQVIWAEDGSASLLMMDYIRPMDQAA